MRVFFAVAGYTIKEYLTKKSFIISTIIMLLIAGIAGSFPAIKDAVFNRDKTSVSDSESSSTDKGGIIFVNDDLKILNGDLSYIEKEFPKSEVKSISSEDVQAKKEDIKNGELESLIVLSKDESGSSVIDFFFKETQTDVTPSKVHKSVSKSYFKAALSSRDLTDEEISLVSDGIGFNSNELKEKKNFNYLGYFVSIVVNLLLFFAIYMYGYGIAMSVASEKTSRVMELLVTSADPNKILLGKVFGMGVLGLAQVLAVTGIAFGSFMITSSSDIELYRNILSSIHISPLNVIVIIIYFILGYTLFSLMNSVAGSCVSKAEDVNSALTPINMVVLFSFYLSYFTMQSPNSVIAKFASYFPLSSPFAMTGRVFNTEVSVMHLAISIGILTVTVILIAMLSLKLYSRAVLHYGERLKLKDIFKISK